MYLFVTEISPRVLSVMHVTDRRNREANGLVRSKKVIKLTTMCLERTIELKDKDAQNDSQHL